MVFGVSYLWKNKKKHFRKPPFWYYVSMISVRSCTRLIVGTCSLGVRYQKSRVLPTTSKQEIGCFWQVKMISPHFHHGPMASLGLQHSNSGIRQPSHGQGLRHWICPAVCGPCKRPISKSQALNTFFVTVKATSIWPTDPKSIKNIRSFHRHGMTLVKTRLYRSQSNSIHPRDCRAQSQIASPSHLRPWPRLLGSAMGSFPSRLMTVGTPTIPMNSW